MHRTVVLPFLLGLSIGIALMLLVSWNSHDVPRQKVVPGEVDVAAVKAEEKTGDTPADPPDGKPQEIPVLVVTAKTIAAEQAIAPESIAVHSLRVGDVPPGAIGTIEELQGLVLRSMAYRGDVITRPKLIKESDIISRLPVKQEPDPRSEIAVLVVAAGTIPPRRPITDEMVVVRSIRLSDVPPAFLQKKEDLKGLVLKSTAYQGDVITRLKLEEVRKDGTADPGEIPEGFRLLTLKVDSTLAHMKGIRAQDVVDVFATYKTLDSERKEQLETKLVSTKLRVFVAGKPSPVDQSRNISLLVTPKQAAVLMMADRKGEITMAVRADR